jgi:hypothetical protein
LLPLSIYLLFYKRNKGLKPRVIFFYCLYSFLNDILIFWASNVKNDALLYKLLSSFTVIEYGLFSYFLYLIIENQKFKRFIVFISVGFILISIIAFIHYKNARFDSISASIEAIIIITFSIYYLYEQIDKPQISFIYLSYTFWFTFSFLIYLSGTFFLFIQSSDLPDQTRNSFWIINLICNLLKNVLFAVGFSIPKSKEKESFS